MLRVSYKLLSLVGLGFLLASTPTAAAPAGAKLWSLAPVERPPVPDVRARDWTRNPIDAFVLARLEAAGLEPAPEASRSTLLRRLSFDLIGLPPTPAEVAAFVADTAPGAYERQVERLLASPRYGERWAQHWLDVVRYADSEGFEYDRPSPHAWRYRDWVIDAFNSDKSFPRFVAEQVAGDELTPGNLEALAATGLHRLGPVRRNAGFQFVEKERQEFLVEVTDTIGNAFLGLTIGCAKCHDHKFDPFSQADYYRLQAFFAGTVAHEHSLAGEVETKEHETATEKWTTADKKLTEARTALEAPHRQAIEAERRARLTSSERAALAKDAEERTLAEKFLANQATAALKIDPADVKARLTPEDAIRHQEIEAAIEAHAVAKPAPLPAIMTVKETHDEEPETYVLRAGIVGAHQERVERGFPTAVVLQRAEAALETPTETSQDGSPRGTAGRRSELARWLVSPDHPLTARVFVNRLWQHHFRRGVVSTPGDFGHMGTEPTHPELLSWLTAELWQAGGSPKAIHRLIVRSATYRQAFRLVNHGSAEDRLLSGRRRLRLDAEAIRDSVLAVAGTLNLQTGGPGVRLPLLDAVAEQMYVGKWRPHPNASQHTRRSVYRFVKRNLQPALFWAFDAPSTVSSCSERTVSSHSGQALSLLNGPFLNGQAAAFAERLQQDVGLADNGALVDRAYACALSRSPSADERRLGVEFLQTQPGVVAREGGPPQRDTSRRLALVDYCLTLLNLDEFLFVE